MILELLPEAIALVTVVGLAVWGVVISLSRDFEGY